MLGENYLKGENWCGKNQGRKDLVEKRRREDMTAGDKTGVEKTNEIKAGDPRPLGKDLAMNENLPSIV